MYEMHGERIKDDFKKLKLKIEGETNSEQQDSEDEREDDESGLTPDSISMVVLKALGAAAAVNVVPTRIGVDLNFSEFSELADLLSLPLITPWIQKWLSDLRGVVGQVHPLLADIAGEMPVAKLDWVVSKAKVLLLQNHLELMQVVQSQFKSEDDVMKFMNEHRPDIVPRELVQYSLIEKIYRFLLEDFNTVSCVKVTTALGFTAAKKLFPIGCIEPGSLADGHRCTKAEDG
jgi:hypothetical protein